MDLISHLVPWFAAELQEFEARIEAARLPHAILLEGPAGIGKLNLALNIAARLTTGAAAMAELDAGQARRALEAYDDWMPGQPDLHLVRPETGKAVIGVDGIRVAIEALPLTGHGGLAKVAVICPAQLLNRAAANALLKTLEEPTPQTYLLLVAHNRGNLPATIVSRCQRRLLGPPPAETALAWLGDSLDGASERLALAGGAPLSAVAMSSEIIKLNRNIEEILLAISRGQSDPVAAAERWAKEAPGQALEAIARVLGAAIRDRSRDSKSVTDLGTPRLHNAFDDWTLPTLFQWHDEIMAIRRALGTGLNTELQLRSVLVAMAKP